MARFIFLTFLISAQVQTTAQSWLYAKVWPDKSSQELSKLKLVPTDGGDPFFIVSRQETFPDQHSWNWMSEEGGVLRLFLNDSAIQDSAVLISGQTRRTAFWEKDTWFLPNGNQPLVLRMMDNEKTWLLEVVLDPIEGIQSQPEPILILSLVPHPKKKNRFLIESTGNLQSIPVVLLELGISLALITMYH